MLLVGDIGGTNTRLGLIDPERGARNPVRLEVYPSGSAPNLETLVRRFLAGISEQPERAVFGVAGPIDEGIVKVTNLQWLVDSRALATALDGAPVRLCVCPPASGAAGSGRLARMHARTAPGWPRFQTC